MQVGTRTNHVHLCAFTVTSCMYRSALYGLLGALSHFDIGQVMGYPSLASQPRPSALLLFCNCRGRVWSDVPGCTMVVTRRVETGSQD